MPFAAYEPARSCGNAGPGATNLMYWLDKESPWAGTLGNYGVYNCRLPSIHSEARAGDSSVPVVKGGHPAGHAVVEFLTACGLQLGIMETIFARQRRSAKAPRGEDYTGVSPHWDHVHWAITHKAADLLNVPTIRAVYAAYASGRPNIPSAGKPTTPAAPPVDLAAIHRLVQEDTDMILICNGKGIAHVIDKDCWSAISVAELEQVRAAYKKAARSLPELTVSAARWNQYLS